MLTGSIRSQTVHMMKPCKIMYLLIIFAAGESVASCKLACNCKMKLSCSVIVYIWVCKAEVAFDSAMVWCCCFALRRKLSFARATYPLLFFVYYVHPRYTAVRIKNCSKSMSVIKVATARNMKVPRAPQLLSETEVSIALLYQLCSTCYTAVRIKKCLKSTSVLKVSLGTWK